MVLNKWIIQWFWVNVTTKAQYNRALWFSSVQFIYLLLIHTSHRQFKEKLVMVIVTILRRAQLNNFNLQSECWIVAKETKCHDYIL